MSHLVLTQSICRDIVRSGTETVYRNGQIRVVRLRGGRVLKGHLCGRVLGSPNEQGEYVVVVIVSESYDTKRYTCLSPLTSLSDPIPSGTKVLFQTNVVTGRYEIINAECY